jgi:hypothetical protein
MNYRLLARFAAVTVGFLFLVLLLVAESGAWEAKKVGGNKKLRTLREERLDTVTKIHDAVLKWQLPIEQVHQAKLAIHSAKLDLCETKEQRLKVYQDTVDDAREWEKRAERNALNETLAIDFLKAKGFRLEMEIGLEKFKDGN